MSYRLERDESVADGVVRIIREQIDRAMAEIEDPDLDEHRSVHLVNARGTRIRAVYRLAHQAGPDVCEREDRWYRELVAPLAEIHDADAALDAFDVVHRHFRRSVDEGAMDVIRETLEERRDELADELSLDERLEAAREQLREALDRSVPIGADDFDALAGGLARTYAQARDAFTDAYEQATTRAFRQWHEQATYHGHHVGLLQDAWPAVFEARREELQDLTDVTADDHDLAQLRATVLTEPENFPDEQVVEAFVALLDRQRARLQREAEPLGTRLFAEEPDPFVQRVSAAWEAWRSGAGPEQAGPEAEVALGG